MNKRNNKYRYFGLFCRFILLSCLCALLACSNPNNPQNYIKTFDHVLTDQYVWGYGGGGIYWVSNEQVILEAHIKNQNGELDLGIYQVDIRDGSYKKVVEVPDKTPINYTYCFEGNTLHVMSSLGTFKETHSASGYQVEIRELGKKTKSNSYSALRCNFVERPTADDGYSALRANDGFIKYIREGSGVLNVFLADENGNNIKKLTEHKDLRKGSPEGIFLVSHYLDSKNAYFGYSPLDNNTCTELWWLYREGWTIKNEKLCLPKWSSGSLLLHNLDDALYIEHYTSKTSKSYLLKDRKEFLIERGLGRGASDSPDGCRVAYAEGDSDEHSGKRQVLKVFEYCSFRSSKSS